MKKWCKHVITLLYHLKGFGKLLPLFSPGPVKLVSILLQQSSSHGSALCPMRSFGYLRITTFTSLTHGHANGYQLSLIFIDIFAASSTLLNGLHLQHLPAIRSLRLAALFSPFPPQPCLLHCKCYCGKTMTTQHSAPRSRRNATSRVRS